MLYQCISEINEGLLYVSSLAKENKHASNKIYFCIPRLVFMQDYCNIVMLRYLVLSRGLKKKEQQQQKQGISFLNVYTFKKASNQHKKGI